MALGFVFYDKTDALSAVQLFSARLLGIEMIEARFARKNLPVFGQLQSLAL